jgi:hypothetical protein
MDIESIYFYSIFSINVFYFICYCLRQHRRKNRKHTKIVGDLLAKHFARYLGLTVIFIVPVYALSYLYSDLDYLRKSVVKVLIGTFFQIAALYIWPLVFLKRGIFNPMYEGFTFLIQNPWKSTPLLLLIILTSTIKLFAILSPVFIFKSTNIMFMVGLGYFHNITSAYIGLIIFSMATALLLEKK